MSFRIPIGKVVVTPEEKDAVLQTLDLGILSPGPKVKEFEEKFAFSVGADFGVMVNSGTDALRIALLAMKEKYHWQDGDEVIVPALTFVATINTVLQAGLKPVFVDINALSDGVPYCLNPGPLSWGDVVTRKTRLILPVDLFGINSNSYGFIFGQTNNVIRHLTDSCESLHELAGDVACYSFYACHLLTLGVGGMIATNDAQIAEYARSYANHGRDPNFLGMQTVWSSHFGWKDRFTFLRDGYSCRPMELQGALGIEKLKTIKNVISQRQRNAIALSKVLGPFEELRLVYVNPFSENRHWMMFPILLNDDRINLEDFCESLEQRGIETRPLLPLLTQPYFQKLFPGEAEKHPIALRASKRGFYIGCHEYLTEDDIQYIGKSFEACLPKKEALVA